MNYTIRKSTLQDLPVILRLRDQAREIMRGYGNVFQWPDGYPPEERFRQDIDRGGSYVMADESGAIVATFALLPGPDPTYNVIYDGQWLDDEPYHVVHRIASTPESHGVFTALMDYCESVAPNIRIDTHTANVIMRHGLERRGYSYCGTIIIADGTERMAFQKNNR
ncbi:MAG: GNAT family N-acetyltransferase [Bacteroidales bacterium]|nr:GNAT family N-acetyltransferase [Bacteroidales bacterium]